MIMNVRQREGLRVMKRRRRGREREKGRDEEIGGREIERERGR